MLELHTGSGEQFARVGKLDLCYETFGDPGAPPVLLVMGLGAQMVLWDDRFCEMLAERGFFVIRFDNRDIGRSTILRGLGVPSRMQLFVRDRRGAKYSLDDMAGDAAGLMRELNIGAAHVVGVSMGGMIAQLLAIHHPRRVRSLVSIMSSTGNRRVGQAHPRLWPRMLRRLRLDREGYIRDFIETYQTIGSTRYPPNPERMRGRAERCFERGLHPSGSARQLAAIITAYDRTPFLEELEVPTTVIHGTADPLVRPSGGRATAAAIPGARLLMLDGMGHDMPPELWPQIIDAIAENAESASNP
ncbi:MAG: alpha/beta fold hydrolase [Solirubrobacteraceae bacterium]